MKRKRLILAAAVLLVVGAAAGFLLWRNAAEGGERSIDPPKEYRIGGVGVTALPVMADGITVYREDGAQEDASGGETDGAVGNTASAVFYRYEGLSNAGALISAYTTLLTAPETGFFVVDQALVKTDAPDFEAEEGSVRLARRAAESGKVMSIQITWTKGACAVVTDAPEGEVSDPPAPEGVTISQALDYMRSLPPSVLGLEGSSMAGYDVYALDGMAVVDGLPCMRVSVYRKAENTNTNVVEGSYLLSADQRHIYRVDEENGEVKEVAAGWEGIS